MLSQRVPMRRPQAAVGPHACPPPGPKRRLVWGSHAAGAVSRTLSTCRMVRERMVSACFLSLCTQGKGPPRGGGHTRCASGSRGERVRTSEPACVRATPSVTGKHGVGRKARVQHAAGWALLARCHIHSQHYEHAPPQRRASASKPWIQCSLTQAPKRLASPLGVRCHRHNAGPHLLPSCPVAATVRLSARGAATPRKGRHPRRGQGVSLGAQLAPVQCAGKLGPLSRLKQRQAPPP